MLKKAIKCGGILQIVFGNSVLNNKNIYLFRKNFIARKIFFVLYIYKWQELIVVIVVAHLDLELQTDVYQQLLAEQIMLLPLMPQRLLPLQGLLLLLLPGLHPNLPQGVWLSPHPELLPLLLPRPLQLPRLLPLLPPELLPLLK
jgi:hypothetical protein